MTEEITAPIDLINIVLGYDGFNPIKGHGAAPLVSTLFNSIKTQKLAHLKELLTAIVNGQPDTVKAMLEKDPSLLLEKLDENDYVTALSGQRCNNVTAYRTALAVEDTEMAAMIKKKLIDIAGKKAAHTQFHQQFPDKWIDKEKEKWTPVVKMLDTLTDVIRHANLADITSSDNPEYKLTVREGSEVAKALAQLRSLLDARLLEIVTTGRHFNPKLLLKAFQMYNDLYMDAFGYGVSDPRSILFWQQVIGAIQRAFPVNYVQAFCHYNLYETIENLQNNHPQNRSLIMGLYVNDAPRRFFNFYPLVVSRLGFDYAIYDAGRACGATAGCQGHGFQRLYQLKTSLMQALYKEPHLPISCNIS